MSLSVLIMGLDDNARDIDRGVVSLVDGKLVYSPANDPHIGNILLSPLVRNGQVISPDKQPEEFLRNLHREYDGAYLRCSRAQDDSVGFAFNPDEARDHGKWAKTPGSPDEGTPREDADRAAEKQKEDYAFARKSAVPNAGEDVMGSARHTRNQWRGLAEAEQAGTAADLVTRDKLFKNEPPNLLAGVTPATSLSSLAMHLALEAFPKQPEDGRYSRGEDRNKGGTAETRRKEFVDSYMHLKNAAEQIARKEVDPNKALNLFHGEVSGLIQTLRGVGTNNRFEKQYNAVANQLIGTLNKVRSGYRVSKTSVPGQLLDFAGRVKKAYGTPTRETMDKVAEHVRDIIEGDSFNKTFGTVKTGGDTLKPADLYVKVAERVGGPVIDAGTVKAGTDFLMNKVGLRGLQYGNSVTDDERQHHLQKASEAFADLADILKLPQRMVSLNGALALAVGARGTGTALAQYFPGRQIINLTRKNGVGSLAHEIFHAWDDMIGRETQSALKQKVYGYPRDVKTAGTLFSGIVDRLPANTPAVMAKSYKDLLEALKPFRERIKQWIRTSEPGRMLSAAKRAYWLSPEEVFARAGEKHVQTKLDDAGRKNTYLAGVKDHPLWPTQEESRQLQPFFDKLFSDFKEAAANSKFTT